jgi:hypothetical protein
MNLYWFPTAQSASTSPIYLPQPPASPVRQEHSDGYLIQKTFFDMLANHEPFFAGYNKRLTKMEPVQAHLLPYLGVYLVDENMGPDGDANCTDIRFSHTLRIGFSVAIAHNNQDDAHRMLDQAFAKIMNRLWRDPYVMNVWNTYNPWNKTQNAGNVEIESIVRGQRKHNFGLATGNNETPFAELQYTASCFYRTMWDPEFP